MSTTLPPPPPDRTKALPKFPLGRIGCIFALMNLALALALTFTSLQHVTPPDCQRICDTPAGTACPSGACRIGEQRAGWPLPFVVDSPGGGSPTSGWAILGPEDPPLLPPFVADTLIYSIILWLISYAMQAARRRPLPFRLALISMPLTA